MIHKVLAVMVSVPYLPGLPEGAQVFFRDFHASEARVVPRAHASGQVDEVNLTLRSLSLLYTNK